MICRFEVYKYRLRDLKGDPLSKHIAMKHIAIWTATIDGGPTIRRAQAR